MCPLPAFSRQFEYSGVSDGGHSLEGAQGVRRSADGARAPRGRAGKVQDRQEPKGPLAAGRQATPPPSSD